jgi:hypothetical protein
MHVPRTSGVFIRNIIADRLNSEAKVLGHGHLLEEGSFANAEFVSGHFGVEPLKYSQKAFSIIRDPNKLTFSYIKHIHARLKMTIPFEELLNIYLSPSEFSFAVSNLITKSLTGTVDIEEYNKYYTNQIIMVDNCWFLKDHLTDHEDVISFIKDKNIKIYIYESENVYSNILSDNQIDNTDVSGHKAVNNTAKTFDNLYNKYFDKIKELNNLDIAVYEYFNR